MKKLICILLSVLIMSTGAFAQDNAAPKGKPATHKKATGKKPTDKKDGNADAAKPGKMKKDCTPDMRHKENKEAAKPKGKLKKDGTPDMRYKENKEAAKKK